MHKRLSILAVAFIVSVQGLGIAQSTGSSSAIPSVLLQSHLPSVFELLQTRYHFDNDGTGFKEVKARIRILDPMGIRQRSEESFEYHPLIEGLRISYVRIRKRNGNVVNIAKDVVQSVRGSNPQYDYDERRLRILGLEVGDLLEYDVVTVMKHTLGSNGFCVQHNFTSSEVIDEQLEIDLPSEKQINVRSSNFVFSETVSDAQSILRWEHQSPRALVISNDPYLPGRTPDVQVSTFASWNEVGHWSAAIDKNARVPSETVKRKALELTQGSRTDIERVKAV